MFEIQISEVAGSLKFKGYMLLKGLTESQINRAQDQYNIIFPPELKELLMTFNPYQFYDWADFSKSNIAKIKRSLYWPIEGLLFDIKQNSFWIDSWGDKPPLIDSAVEVAKYHLSKIPPLIPIYLHRYMPSCPNEAGNPVYSVYQTDIIYYGKDLWDYFSIEFGYKNQQSIDFEHIKAGIPFWGEIVG